MTPINRLKVMSRHTRPTTTERERAGPHRWSARSSMTDSCSSMGRTKRQSAKNVVAETAAVLRRRLARAAAAALGCPLAMKTRRAIA